MIRESFQLGGGSGRMLVSVPVEEAVMAGVFTPCLISSVGEPPRLGDPLVDEYLRFTAARVRPNSLVAQSFDLKVFFTVVTKPPRQVDVSDVLGFIEE